MRIPSPTPTVTDVEIETYVGSIGVIGVIIITIITIAQIKIHLICSCDGDFAWRVITYNALRIFAVRGTRIGILLCGYTLVVLLGIHILIFIVVIWLIHTNRRTATVVLIDIPTFRVVGRCAG